MHSSGKNWPGLILVCAGLFGLISILLAVGGFVAQTGFDWFVLAWGDLLYRSFHLAGLYMPIYLIACGLAIFLHKAGNRLVLWLSLAFIPILFAALALRLMLTNDFTGSILPAWMAVNLTQQGAVIVSAALSLISLIALLQAPNYFSHKTEPEEAARPPVSRPMPVQEPSTQESVQGHLPRQPAETPRGPVPAGSAIKEFSQAMEGKLESRIRPASRPPIDLDAPLEDAELNDAWVENPEKLEAIAAPNYVPRRPMFYNPQNPDNGDDYDELLDGPKMEVYFSKEGGISDYPPRGRHSFVTLDESTNEAGEQSADSVTDQTELAVASASAANPIYTDQADSDEEWEETLQEAADDRTIFPANDHPASAVPLPTSEVAPPDEDEHSIVLDQANINRAETVTQQVSPPNPANHPVNPMSEHPLVSQAITAPIEDSIDTSLLPPLDEAKSWGNGGTYNIPIQGVLDEPKNHQYWVIDDLTTRSASILKQTLEEFGIAADVTGIRKGPVITMFEILPAPGVKLARIVNLSDNIALRLAAQSVRIVAPIPGKHAVGIEIPNKERAVVSFAELLMAEGFSSPKIELPVALGKDISGEAQIVDLTKTPHLLIAGATGSGKSVCVNALICSILYRRSPAEVKMILIDPKIVELKFYNDIPHLLTPVITDPKKAFQALQWCLFEMERRYSLLDAMQVRDIKSYNRKIKARNIATPHLPYLVVVIDEFADLMATSGKELEGTLARLAAMSRAVGIHLVLATQRPSADVITGLIKANIPSRIAFMVASKIDSRIIIDGMGADKLLGKGDMLFTSAWDPFPFRMQGAFLSEEEVERIVTKVKLTGKPDYIDDEIFFDAEDDEVDDEDIIDAADDPLLKEAIDIVVTAKKASASYLQRRLKIGYNRAARMVEQMEEMGIVGPAQGSKAREILRMYQ